MKFMRFAAWFLIVMAVIMLILVVLEALAGNAVRAVNNVLYLAANLMWARIAWVYSEVQL